MTVAKPGEVNLTPEQAKAVADQAAVASSNKEALISSEPRQVKSGFNVEKTEMDPFEKLGQTSKFKEIKHKLKDKRQAAGQVQVDSLDELSRMQHMGQNPLKIKTPGDVKAESLEMADGEMSQIANALNQNSANQKVNGATSNAFSEGGFEGENSAFTEQSSGELDLSSLGEGGEMTESKFELPVGMDRAARAADTWRGDVGGLAEECKLI